VICQALTVFSTWFTFKDSIGVDDKFGEGLRQVNKQILQSDIKILNF